MAEWVTVLSLVSFGLLLLILELIFIPGTTVVGLIGLISLGFGVYFGYDYFGSAVGSAILGGSSLIFFTGVYISFRTGVWGKFALKNILSSKVNEDEEPLVIGDVGVAISALRPSGKAEFKNIIREVSSQGNYIDVGQKIRVIRVVGKKVLVEIATKKVEAGTY
ncbi:NfeD family protein [Flexithrix dorotheae]|uniref:NfeD family protein n=1 Tax=Flexithrix dorotheae TaxID=70993 RepID=UPI00037A7736|nr:NfeD family protein [Flexithrix dorotheae]